MEIRKGTLKDLEAIAAVEAACFPAAEAATAEEFAGRLQQYGDHFWLLWEGERLLAFVDGFCTDWPDLTDEMYADASLHRGTPGSCCSRPLPTPGPKAGRGWY